MKAALIQLRVQENETPQERWVRVEHILSDLQGKSVDLICLPELWCVGFNHFSSYVTQSEPLQGTTVLRLAAWARRLNCYIMTGSFVEENGEHYYNTTVLLDHRGIVCGTYRKMHLFGYQSQEPEILTAGSKTTEIFTSYGILGLATCYDLRFPEQFRRMVERGTTLFCVTAAWPIVRLEDWRLFCRVRALENQSFLLACNHVGTHSGVTGAGHSIAVAPDGTILAEAGADEIVLFVQLELNQTEKFRQSFPALHDRIPMK